MAANEDSVRSMTLEERLVQLTAEVKHLHDRVDKMERRG